MRARLVTIGAGGHGKVVADCAADTGRYQSIVFLDSHYPVRDKVADWPVISEPDSFEQFIDNDTDFFVAIGDNFARRDWLDRLVQANASITSLIHPSAVVSSRVEVGQGSLLAPGVVINVDSSIGQGTIINTRAHIDHDGSIGDFVHIGPGSHIAGTVHVGDLSFIGIGTSVIQGVHIGQNVQTGAGAAVVEDIPDHSLAVGVPAKPIKQRPRQS